MTDKVAAAILESRLVPLEWRSIYEAVAVALKALNKQIPKKLIEAKPHADGMRGKCSNCKQQITLCSNQVNYCFRCGQKIDKEK